MNIFKQKMWPLTLKNKCLLFLLAVVVVAAVAYLAFIRPVLMRATVVAAVDLIAFSVVLVAFIVMLAMLVVVLVMTIVRVLFMRHNEQNRIWYKRLKHHALWSGVLGLLLALLVLASQLLAFSPLIRDAAGKVVPGSIARLDQVDLNNSRQWISIRGADETKPVLLFLAGGPGGSQLAAVRDQLSELEQHFVVVGWDQPGSAKSFHAVPQRELTPERYINDGCALAQYLCDRFRQEKIYLVGESWGSALGIWMVQRRPELFRAFVGTGQMVSFMDTENDCYARAIKTAQERGDTQVVQNLILQGPPPYYGDGVALKMATYLMYLFNVMSDNPDITYSSHNTFTDLAGTEYGLYDKLTYILGLTETLGVVYQQLYDLDLRDQALNLAVPVYFFEGEHDINAPIYLVEDYCARLDAPSKQIIWFEHSGHTPWVDENDLFVQTLVDMVLTD